MKKVLIFAYDFPPYVSVGGLRPYSWFKYFHEFGFYPIVITRQWSNKYGNHLDYVATGESDKAIVEVADNGTIIRTPYKPNLSNRLLLKYGENRFRIFRKLITALYEFAQWCFFIGAKVGLYKGAVDYLQNNKVDCIIATGDPFVLFRYASSLSKKYQIPWIADYRDPWTQSKQNSKNFFIKWWNSYFEKKILNNCSKIITVSDFVKGEIESLIKEKEFEIIPNGYDLSLVENISISEQSTDVLTVGFVGTVYPWHPMKSILEVFSDFKKLGKDIKINFYGVNIADNIKLWVENDYPILQSSVSVFPRIPNEELLKLLSKSNVLLLVNYYSFMGTKIFDYLGLKRRIIFCYSDDEESKVLKEKHYTVDENDFCSKTLQEDLIKETNSGIIVENKAHLKEVLINLYEEFKDKGLISCNSKGIEKYSRREQAKNLVKQIEKLVMSKNNSNPY